MKIIGNIKEYDDGGNLIYEGEFKNGKMEKERDIIIMVDLNLMVNI